MAKIKKIIEDSSTPKKFNKNKSFSGVESNKTPKSRRKSISTILPTPFKQKKLKSGRNISDWTITKELGNGLPKKEKKLGPVSSFLNDGLEENSQFSPIPKKVKKNKKERSATDSSELNTPSTSKTIKKKTISAHISHENNDVEAKSSQINTPLIKYKKNSKATAVLVNFVDKESNDVTNKQDVFPLKITKKKKVKAQPKTNLSIGDLQEKFNVKVEDVQNAVKGVIKFRSENPKLQKQLFEERIPLFLQISCVKMPKGHSKILRIPLPHSVLTPDSEVCLIVPEVKGIKNIEHEKHVEHYEDLLRKKGVTNVKKIMTCHELRTEYETFEQKSRLVDLYDIFLADGRISGKVVKKCGKIFYRKRKVPISVKLYATKLKEHIDKALSKVFFFLHLKGDSYTIQFGHDKMDVDKLVENVYSVIEFLDTEFPGGFANVKGIQVYAPRATSVPIYLSFKSPNEVGTPKMKSKVPKAYKSHKGELTTLYNAEVTVRPDGKVVVERKEDDYEEGDSVIANDDVVKENQISEHGISKSAVEKKKSRKRKQKDEASTDEQGDNVITDGDIIKANQETEREVDENAVKKKKSRRRKQNNEAATDKQDDNMINDENVVKKKKSKISKQIGEASTGKMIKKKQNGEASTGETIKKKGKKSQVQKTVVKEVEQL